VHASVMKLTGVAAYLAFVTGLGAVCVNLTRHVGTQAVALALPYVAADRDGAKDEPRPLTLVERRRVEAGVVLAASHPRIVDHAAVPEAPEIPAPILAAQMDLAEKGDLGSREIRRVRRVARSRVSRAVRPTRLAAADAFGRSFGVMLMASR
jgi:hypothetical protein